MLSSHSRLHGSSSYRVPWAYDDEACDVVRFFTKLKCRLMPYLWAAALEAHRDGIPTMRAMIVEYPDDPACDTLDRQYFLGGSLLVAPVFSEQGTVDYYLPAGRWTHLLTGKVQEGGRWYRESHGFLSLPVLVKPGTVLALGAHDDRPDYDHADGVTFRVYELADGATASCSVLRLDRQGRGHLHCAPEKPEDRSQGRWGKPAQMADSTRRSCKRGGSCGRQNDDGRARRNHHPVGRNKHLDCPIA